MPHHMENTTPLLAILLLCLFYPCDAEYRTKCSTNTEPITSMNPSADGVPGRYTIQWCTDVNKNDTVWNWEVEYNAKKPNVCNPRIRNTRHSFRSEQIDTSNLNCTHVCLSTDVDIIFSACYIIKNVLPSRGSMRHEYLANITNEFTIEKFLASPYTGTAVNHGDYVSVTFNTGIIPVVGFDMQLCRLPNNITREDEHCTRVYHNCSGYPATKHAQVRCALRPAAPPPPVPPPPGVPPGGTGRARRYEARLEHLAPWFGGPFVNKKFLHIPFVFPAAGAPEPVSGATGASAALGAAAVALGALLAAAAALALALRKGRAARLRKHVLRDWINRQESKPMSEPARPEPGAILLVYAREGPAAEPCVAALTRLLETVAPGKVYDLYSSRSLAAAAPAPADWLRRLAARPDSRVILLMTPALRALHAVEQPLLGRRGVYREPAAADALIPLLLRLADQAPAPYTQYHLATLEGLETEALPYTVPFRRYVLPRHAAALVQDLAPKEHSHRHDDKQRAEDKHRQQQLIDELSRAVIDFVDHARAHPDYLMDQLIFF